MGKRHGPLSAGHRFKHHFWLPFPISSLTLLQGFALAAHAAMVGCCCRFGLSCCREATARHLLTKCGFTALALCAEEKQLSLQTTSQIMSSIRRTKFWSTPQGSDLRIPNYDGLAGTGALPDTSSLTFPVASTLDMALRALVFESHTGNSEGNQL